MHKLFLIILFIVIVPCSAYKNTQCYRSFWNTKHNSNYQFFDDRTYGSLVYDDPCTPIADNRQFLNFINQNIKCSGAWCIGGKFGSCLGSGRNCYEVEHIIDYGGSEFGKNSACKNIAGNMIMSWGLWNGQLGTIAARDYDSNMHEKEQVYGEDLIIRARQNIARCCGLEDTLIGMSKQQKISYIIITIVTALFLFGALTIYIVRKLRLPREINDHYVEMNNVVPQ